MQKRYRILRYIYILQPVGRRSLSQNLQMTERMLRSEIDFLKAQNLVSVSNTGMRLTKEGTIILGELEAVMKEFSNLTELEQRLTAKLQIKGCSIVSGNTDESDWIKSELGRVCVMLLKDCIHHGDVITVTGGSTMFAVANALTSDFSEKDLTFVPARGGIGSGAQYQANTICEIMAEKSQNQHMVLYVPDHVTKELYDSFILDVRIREVLMKIKSANVVIHGIGDALTMAKRRRSSTDELTQLEQANAVAEAFGYYFDEDGKVVHKVQIIGLQLEDLEQIPYIFAVAGGKSKAKAIKAYMKIAPRHTVLITDEAAANEILKG